MCSIKLTVLLAKSSGKVSAGCRAHRSVAPHLLIRGPHPGSLSHRTTDGSFVGKCVSVNKERIAEYVPPCEHELSELFLLLSETLHIL